MDIKERIVELIDQGKITAEDGARLLEAIKEQPGRQKQKTPVKKWILLGIGGGLLAIVLFVVLGGWAISYLWNATLVPLFHWPLIGFAMALRIALLLAIVGGLLGFSRGFRYNHKRD
jgi:hypothetical protein